MEHAVTRVLRKAWLVVHLTSRRTPKPPQKVRSYSSPEKDKHFSHGPTTMAREGCHVTECRATSKPSLYLSYHGATQRKFLSVADERAKPCATTSIGPF